MGYCVGDCKATTEAGSFIDTVYTLANIGPLVAESSSQPKSKIQIGNFVQFQTTFVCFVFFDLAISTQVWKCRILVISISDLWISLI